MGGTRISIFAPSQRRLEVRGLISHVEDIGIAKQLPALPSQLSVERAKDCIALATKRRSRGEYTVSIRQLADQSRRPLLRLRNSHVNETVSGNLGHYWSQ